MANKDGIISDNDLESLLNDEEEREEAEDGNLEEENSGGDNGFKLFAEEFKGMNDSNRQALLDITETLKMLKEQPEKTNEEKKDDFILSEFMPGQGLDEFDKELDAPVISALKARDAVIDELRKKLLESHNSSSGKYKTFEQKLAEIENIAKESYSRADMARIGDAWEVASSDDFGKWVNTLSPTKKRLYLEIRKSGEPSEVKEIVNEFQESQGGKEDRPSVRSRQRGGVTMDSLPSGDEHRQESLADQYNLRTPGGVKAMFGHLLKKYEGDAGRASAEVKKQVRKMMEN